MAARWLLRIVAWTAVGTALGFLVLPCLDWFDRYPLIGAVLMPAANLLCEAIRGLGLGPGGDAGFVIIPISIVLQWTLLGLMYGIYRALRAERSRAAMASPITDKDVANPMRGRRLECKAAAVSGRAGRSDGPARRLRRVLWFMAAHKELSTWIAIISLAASYCLWQEILLSWDRDFFLRHVDHQAVARACLDILSKPLKQRNEQVALYVGPDPRLPEAIRRLNPECVSIHVDEVSIARRLPNWLTFMQNRNDPTRYDLWYQEGPKCHETLVYSIYR
jgi:hypothetical protein